MSTIFYVSVSSMEEVKREPMLTSVSAMTGSIWVYTSMLADRLVHCLHRNGNVYLALWLTVEG